jgi:zinc transport system substrate-binding protein
VRGYVRIILMFKTVAAGLLVSLALSACGTSEPSDGRATVVVTAWPIEELVDSLVAEDVRVVSLAAPGIEPHDLELDARDLEELTRASLVITVAPGFQPAVDRAVSANDLPVFVASDHVPVVAGEPHSDDDRDPHGDEIDPHLWLDPAAWATVAERLGEGLAPLVEDQEAVRLRAQNLQRTLVDYSQLWERTLADCTRETVVVMHNAFVRWERFGLHIESLLGRVPGSEPTAKRVAELAALVRETGSEVVFTEVGSPDRLARLLADEASVEILTLDPLETAGNPYLDRMTENLTALTEGLDCRLP